MDVSIYCLYRNNFVKAFPKLLETIVAKKIRVMVYCQDLIAAQKCDVLLYSFEQLSFLPHAMKGDKSLLSQDIYISDEVADNPYQATVLVCYGSEHVMGNLTNFNRIIYVLEPQELPKVGELQKHYQESAIPVKVLMQQPDGAWQTQVI